MGRVFALFPRLQRGDLYKCAGPTQLHHWAFATFFWKKDKCPTNVRGWGCAWLELTEP